MALKIELFHEVLLAKKHQQYDPLKISLLGLIVIAIGLASYYFVELAQKRSAVAAYETKQKEFERLIPLSKEAKAREDELNKEIVLADRLNKRIEGRFYWAPVFELVASTVPKNVQITRLGADVTQDAPRTCRMLIDGLAAGVEPRAVAEELRTAIVEKLGQKYKNTTAVFKSLDESNEKALLDGKQVQTAVFSINISFVYVQEQAPAQAPRRKAKS